MKSLRACRFILVLIVCLAVLSCSGDDGDAGPAGEDGSDGSDSMIYVVYTSPSPNQTDVKENSAISIIFNKAMDTSSVEDGTTFFVRDSVDINVPGSITWDTDNHILTFTPSSDFNSQSTYRVAILGSVTDNAGNIMGYDYIFYFSVMGLGWGYDRLIEESNEYADHPQIAMDSQGNAIAVWRQDNGTWTNIWASRYTHWGGWGTPQQINSGSKDAALPQIAMDPQGNAIVVWHQINDASPYNSIRYNKYISNYNWVGAMDIVQCVDPNRNVFDPQIAIDDEGNAIAVWKQGDGTGSFYHIWSSSCSSQSLLNWTAPERIEPDDGHNSSHPQIAFDTLGNAIAVWWCDPGLIYANRYTADAGWGTAEQIDAGGLLADQPQVAVEPNGNAVAVWRQSDGIRTNIWANLYTEGSGWGTAELIENNDAGAAEKPQAVIDADGNALAVWQQLASSSSDIWSNRYTAGVGWGTAELLETATGWNYLAETPQIAMDSDGNALAVWKQGDGTGSWYHIWSNAYTAGTGWGTAEIIEPHDPGNSSNPQITINQEDNAMAIWSNYTLGWEDIHVIEKN